MLRCKMLVSDCLPPALGWEVERPHWNSLTDKAINYMPENICTIRETALPTKSNR